MKNAQAQAVKFLRLLVREKILTALILMFIVVSTLSQSFLGVGNLANLLTQIGLYGVVALGMTFAIIGGDFDLGAGSMVSFASMAVAALLPVMGTVLSILAAMVFALISGLINGLLVAKAKINAFIVTFGSMVALKGLALSIGEGRPISTAPYAAFNRIATAGIGRVSLIFIVFMVLLVACHYVLTYTRFGRNIYATGGNFDVAKATGINVGFYKMMLFVLSGLFAAAGGILMASRVTTGHPTIGDDMTMTVIAGVVIGGTSLAGGKGNIWRTLLGITVMMFLSNAFDALVIQPYVQRIIKGAIIIGVVAFDSYSKKKIDLSEGTLLERLTGKRRARQIEGGR